MGAQKENPIHSEAEFDFNSVLELNFDGDAEIFREVGIAFFSEEPKLLAELETFSHAKDFSNIARLAHKLKGVYGSFNYEICVRITTEMEAKAKVQNVECLALVDSLRAHGQTMRSQLESYLLSTYEKNGSELTK